MAGKKDFAGINTGRVYSSIEQATSEKGQQGTASPQEAAERAAELRTQGRKGCKAIRINMAFTPDNHEFIRVMAKITGKTMTEFANLVIERYRTEHPELYEQAKAIIDQL
jgi:enhancing lycopene biosynthesis protein 2